MRLSPVGQLALDVVHDAAQLDDLVADLADSESPLRIIVRISANSDSAWIVRELSATRSGISTSSKWSR